jgi:hypothetical protein
MTFDAAAPRFPHVDPGAGHYESYFLKGHHPDRAEAFWLRHTVHQRPNEPATASLWLTVFDDGGPPRAGKTTVAAGSLRVPDGGYVAIGDSELTPARATGRLDSPTLDAEWDLTFATDEPEQRHLPAAWMYTAGVPRTKSLTPHPAARFGGRLRAGDRTLDLDGWVGVVSHNWGSEHAERWVWMHCGQFAGRGRDTWLELVLGRIRLGPVVVPWIANGALSLDGRRHRLGGPRRVRSTRVDESPTRCRFVTSGDGVRLEGEISAPAERFVTWRYADPAGPEHHSAHCSVADLRLEVRLDGGAPVVLDAPAAGSYELGMKEADHGLTLQPYADGQL